MSERVWLCSDFDIQSRAIINYLQKNGEKVFITKRTWPGLEPEITEVFKNEFNRVKTMTAEYDIGYDDEPVERLKETVMSQKLYDSLPHAEKDDNYSENMGLGSIYTIGAPTKMPPDFSNLYTIGIYGALPTRETNNIINQGDMSAFERVVEIVKKPMTLQEVFVSENAKGKERAMYELGYKYLMSKEEIEEVIHSIKEDFKAKSSEAIGVTLDGINYSSKKDLIIIEDVGSWTPGEVVKALKNETHNLLICTSDGKGYFYGDMEKSLKDRGYFSGVSGEGLSEFPNEGLRPLKEIAVVDVITQALSENRVSAIEELCEISPGLISKVSDRNVREKDCDERSL